MAEAIDMIASGLDALFSAGLTPVNSRDAISCVQAVEVLRRRVDAAAVELLGEIDDGCFHLSDGHASAKVMVAHHAKLSGGEAAARDKARRVLADLPEVAAAYRDGSVGTDQVRVLGRVHANPRVRHLMRDRQAWFLAHARRLDFDRFAGKATDWANLVDENGPEPKAQVHHERRNANLTQDFDWEKARAEHGEAATYNDLPRSIQQRRADALWQLFQDAAASPHGAVPPGFVHNIVWDADTFEEMARRVATGETAPLDPDAFRCETLDGVRLDAHEAFANALNARIRRALIDGASVVIDLGEARLFTGLSRHAVKLGFTECVWVGCHVPSSVCEADHLREHSRKGRTCPGNGAPLCGRHNRWKQKGFTVHRDPAGCWHTLRPDGTEIPA